MISTYRVWPTWPYQLFMAILFLGPPVAAVFIASNVALMQDLGWLARSLLSTYVCPTPAKSYEIMGAPMAVCARCWGATIGLWISWVIVRRATVLPTWFGWHWLVRLGTALVPFGVWWLEIHWWPQAAYSVLLINGAIAGASAGAFFCSLWPGLIPPHAIRTT